MPQALLTFTCTQITRSGHSLAELAACSGVCRATLRQLMVRPGFRELESLERALVAAGLNVVGRDRDGRYHPICVAATGWQRGHQLDSAAAESLAPIRRERDGLLAVLSSHCHTSRLNTNQLSQQAGIPYASARRLLNGKAMRVATTLQRVLAALGFCLVAVTTEGDCLPVPLVPLDPARGAARRDAHAQCLRRWRQRHPDCHRDQHATGRLRIGKGEVVDLHRNQGMNYAEIGRIAGVSRHRVRQIVTMVQNAAGVT